MNWEWPADVKTGDVVIVPIPGKDGKTHDYPVKVSKVFPSTSDSPGRMIVGFMPNLPTEKM